jgi:hypothetical protein
VFRTDIATIKRIPRTEIEGETIWGEEETIYKNIPCHLSVKSLSPINQTQSTAEVIHSFKLFYDTKLGLTIAPNDKVYVTTQQGQEYELVAGQSKKYALTTQTSCDLTKKV